MPVEKTEQKQEVFRLYVEEGIRDPKRLAEETNLSLTTVNRVIKESAREAYRSKLSDARKLVRDGTATDAHSLHEKVGLPLDDCTRIIDDSKTGKSLPYSSANSTLFSAGQILVQAGNKLLNDIAENGYTDENVKNWLALANAFEEFRTGEYKLEMIVAGMGDFAEFVHEHADTLGIDASFINKLADVMTAHKEKLAADYSIQVEG